MVAGALKDIVALRSNVLELKGDAGFAADARWQHQSVLPRFEKRDASTGYQCNYLPVLTLT